MKCIVDSGANNPAVRIEPMFIEVAHLKAKALSFAINQVVLENIAVRRFRLKVEGFAGLESIKSKNFLHRHGHLRRRRRFPRYCRLLLETPSLRQGSMCR